MKKFTVLALVAAVMVSGSAFAVTRHLATNATFSNGLLPTSTNNNDTCDIGQTPAATLLLPYFDVDFSGANTHNTIFTIVNTSRFPQIAHVVLWTDWSFAALDFNIFLTGYDVQSISMNDIFRNGTIAPPAGTSALGSANGPGTGSSPTLAAVQAGNTSRCGIGCTPVNNANPPTQAGANPNFTAAVGTGATNGCVNLPGAIPATLLADLKTVFTTGSPGSVIGATCTDKLGGVHTDAIGYVTIDVASNCTTNLPGPTYFTADILFDNTLTGDYEQIIPGGGALTNASGGSPLVHIRAIPEGGLSGSSALFPGGLSTNLPFTFYDRYTASPGVTTNVTLAAGARLIDRRQPLPSTWAARWIQGGSNGFNTNFQIWREGLGSPFGSATDCGAGLAAPDVPPANSALAIRDEVRFDEHENAVGVTLPSQISPTTPNFPLLPETSSTPSSTSLPFPPAVPVGTDVAGWMYLNLANNGTGFNDFRLTAQRAGFGPALGNRTTTQNWVVVNMQAAPSFSALFDATWLGNGCTPAPIAGAVIAPATQAGGPLVCPPPLTVGGGCGTGTLPPATNP